MPDFLLNFDRHLFYFVNHDLANTFFDCLMPLMRTARLWIPLYLFIIGFSVWRYKRQGIMLILMLCLAVGFADFTSASIVKKLVQRARPCRDVVTSKTVIARANCGTGYSFPSTHATDHFAVAIFLACALGSRYRWLWPVGIAWATIICFAQVYVGVHFPVDVIVGGLYGSLVGWSFARGFYRWQPKFVP